jgi:hypothetical protein
VEWAEIINIGIGVLVPVIIAIGLPLALRKHKKQGPKQVERFYEQLRENGVNCSLVEEGNKSSKIRVSKWSGTKILKSYEVVGKQYDHINLTFISTQYGVTYYIEFLVNSPNLGIIKPKKAQLKRTKRRNQSEEIVYKGEKSFTINLELDYQLETLLNRSEFVGVIEIIPETKHGYTRIRTPFVELTPEFLDVINTLARHIKSQF